MTESRCPFRMKGFDQPDTCDEKCAWLMRVIDYDQRNSRVCAMSVIAMRDEMNEWVPANIIDVCANDTLAAENGVSEASVDANDGNADTREKLEADARALQTRIWQAGSNSDGISLSHIIELLDRQAAITERDLCRQCSWPSLAAMPDKEAYDRIAELQAKLDQMTVERDILQDCVDDLNADTSELQKQVEELTAERDKLRDKVRHQSRQLTDTQNALENRNEETKPRWKRDTKKLQNKIDELTSELAAARKAHAQAEHEAVILREKLGRMLDNAHEITRIGGDC